MKGMPTESVSARQRGMDTWSNEDLVSSLFEGQLAAIACIQPILPDIAAAVEKMAQRLKKGGRLIYAGAGASGRLAVQDGVELLPTYSWPIDRVIYLLAGGEAALVRSIEGAEDSADAGIAQIGEIEPTPNDVLIAVAASGTTPFTCACAQTAKSAGSLVIAIASNPGSPLLAEADHPLLTRSGAETVGGSTRMKAGTAQKAVLNMLSTACMIRLGRVFNGHMVDVMPSNDKLMARSAWIVADISGISFDQAKILLEEAGGIKPAVLMAMGLTADQAAKALKDAEGNLREALASRGLT